MTKISTPLQKLAELEILQEGFHEIDLSDASLFDYIEDAIEDGDFPVLNNVKFYSWVISNVLYSPIENVTSCTIEIYGANWSNTLLRNVGNPS